MSLKLLTHGNPSTPHQTHRALDTNPLTGRLEATERLLMCLFSSSADLAGSLRRGLFMSNLFLSKSPTLRQHAALPVCPNVIWYPQRREHMTDTNYNDGNWHPWTGGECPVHPESVVAVLPVGATKDYTPEMPAQAAAWGGDLHIIAFRVTKEHKEPREWWVKPVENNPTRFWVYDSRRDDCIHVREVIGDDT